MVQSWISKLRSDVLSLSVSNGVRVSHHLKGVKFDVRGVTLLPDMMVDPVQCVSVGDRVQVERDHLVPWHTHFASYEVNEYGLDTDRFYRVQTNDHWEEKVFWVLCFAQLTTYKKSGCRIVGLFAALAEEGRSESRQNISVFTAGARRPVLHWVGALKRLE